MKTITGILLATALMITTAPGETETVGAGMKKVVNGAERTDPQAAYYFRGVEADKSRVFDCDVAVYGGTPAGVTAAIQAARMGKKAILISFDRHVGGMTSGGLTASDLGKKESIGGLALEFYSRLGRKSNFRPSEAESLYRKMLEEAGVRVVLTRPLDAADVTDGHITAIRLLTGETAQAEVFVDATYEGDLLAAANVSYRVGREPASAYGESLGGQWQRISWKGVYQFCDLPLDPYVVPGKPQSGLLPEIAPEKPGNPGEGDCKVQAYNFRMQLTNGAGKISFPKPRGYDLGRYALLARFLHVDPRIQWGLNYTTRPMTDGPVQVRNGDSNNAGSFSSDYVGGNYRWPDGTYEPGSFTELPPPRRGLRMPLRELYTLRERIFQDHVSYQQGLMYFLANDPRVPDELQKRVNTFGLDPNEFPQTGHWPHQLYVREGRRMVSAYVITQANCQSTTTVTDSVGLASYPMDSHFCQRVVVQRDGKTTVRNEGGFGHGCPKPYPISYRAIVPKKAECENLLVPVCLSASHVAYGSIRMEPVFMILGQSAGTAAAIAAEEGGAVQDVDYGELKARLEKAGQRLQWQPPPAELAKPLPGLVMDDSAAKTIGGWQSGTLRPVSGTAYLHDGNNGKGEKSVTFEMDVPTPGRYRVKLLYVANPNRSTKTPVVVSVGTMAKEMLVNQRKSAGGGSDLGTFDIQDSVTVTVANRDTDGYVIADGVQLLTAE